MKANEGRECMAHEGGSHRRRTLPYVSGEDGLMLIAVCVNAYTPHDNSRSEVTAYEVASCRVTAVYVSVDERGYL